MSKTKKELGQHWLYDKKILNSIVDFSDIKRGDNVLEIGPGLGTLTDVLLDRGAGVVAVEIDQSLAEKLQKKYQPDEAIEIHNIDIINFNLKLLGDYKVVANIPYYLTGKIIQKLLEADNKPKSITLLVQKEVAERIAAKPGDMSILAVTAQFFSNVSLGPVVPAGAFTPPPKVDSRVVKLVSRPTRRDIDSKRLFQIVKAGFANKRKKLVNSLSGGLNIDKLEVTEILKSADVDTSTRAQELALDDWYKIYRQIDND